MSMPDDIYYDSDISYDETSIEYAGAVTETTDDNAGLNDAETMSEEQVEEFAETSFRRRIVAVQCSLKAPKSNFNKFGSFWYRNCEDILEGLKPLLAENDLLMTMCDELVFLEGRFYIKATVTVRDALSELSHSVCAYAREPENKKGADQSQVTGSCSSYARKYALSAMWLIDDNKDPDEPVDQQKQPEAQQQAQQPVAQQAMVQQPVVQQTPVVAHCENCGTRFSFDSVEYFTEWVKHPVCCPNPRWVRES